MNTLRHRITKGLILGVDSHAFDKGTLLGDLEAHQNRIKTDPRITEIHKRSKDEVRREMRPFLYGGMAFSGVLWALIAWAGISPIPFCVVSQAFFCALLFSLIG